MRNKLILHCLTYRRPSNATSQSRQKRKCRGTAIVLVRFRKPECLLGLSSLKLTTVSFVRAQSGKTRLG